MEIESEVTDAKVLIVSLKGRMKLQDLQDIELRLKTLIKNHRAVIIDLSSLHFLFSMGLRTLILCAQSMQLKGGRLVLLAPTENVEAVLKASGTTMLIPVYWTRAEAEAAVLSLSKLT